MSTQNLPSNSGNLDIRDISQGIYFESKEYEKAVSFYQKAIEVNPHQIDNYCYLGLAQLLCSHEVDAQATWFFALTANLDQEVEIRESRLLEILKSEAIRQEVNDNYAIAWAIRQHIREIFPDNFDNLLRIIHNNIQRDCFDEEHLHDYEIIETLNSNYLPNVDLNFLIYFIKEILEEAPLSSSIPSFIEACARWSEYLPGFVDTVLVASIHIAYFLRCPARAIELANICLQVKPENPEILRQLSSFYQNNGDFSEGIKTAQQCYSLVTDLADKIFVSHLILRGLLSAGGEWETALDFMQRHKSLISELSTQKPYNLSKTTTTRLFSSTYFLPYCKDSLTENRYLQNQIAQICRTNLHSYTSDLIQEFSEKKILKNKKGERERPLRIGYISHCLKRHSVGWLARWLFEHHDRNKFELYAYMFGARDVNDSVLDWYASQVYKAYRFGLEGLEAAQKINDDEIDILVDLDSITLDVTCEVMALKPADIQVTWLGWDASGLDTIDYFIADPYVLPDWADEHYQEKIWRLPQTYIGVDGFEVGIPTLRRDQLDVPDDAVLYLTGQKGYKRHPDTVRLQLRIIQAVPNSYLLVKGLADEDSIQQLFNQMAVEEGVDPSRLRFLPEVALEAVHRANLGVADIVLDTYPYNGATTTLETLWMCIPMVTRVGEQFAARNSYTMMINAGIQEGIAWTDEEYVEWGIKLGKDAKLRQDIAWRLKQSRQTAPLWNGKQFTREMEAAYEQMWQKYITSETSGDVT